MKKIFILVITLMMAIAISLGATSANAVLVTSLPDGSVISMPIVNYMGTGPQTVATGITWESDNSLSVFGTKDPYGFGGNGKWNWHDPPPFIMAGLGCDSGTMTFLFDTPIYGVGGFLNYLTPPPLFILNLKSLFMTPVIS